MTTAEFKAWARWKYGPPTATPVGVRLELHRDVALRFLGLLDLLNAWRVKDLTPAALEALAAGASMQHYDRTRRYHNAARKLLQMFDVIHCGSCDGEAAVAVALKARLCL